MHEKSPDRKANENPDDPYGIRDLFEEEAGNAALIPDLVHALIEQCENATCKVGTASLALEEIVLNLVSSKRDKKALTLLKVIGLLWERTDPRFEHERLRFMSQLHEQLKKICGVPEAQMPNCTLWLFGQLVSRLERGHESAPRCVALIGSLINGGHTEYQRVFNTHLRLHLEDLEYWKAITEYEKGNSVFTTLMARLSRG